MNALLLLLVGLGLALLRFLYTFIPLSPLTDMVVYFVAAFFLFRGRRGGPWLAMLVAAPTIVLLMFFVVFVGRGLASGIGTYNLIGVVVVPAACLGGWFAASRSLLGPRAP